MRIVFDTNILVNRWHLAGPHFELLARFITQTRSSLIMPKIVLEELQSKYKNALSKTLNEHRRTARDLENMLSHMEMEIPSADIDIQKVYLDYCESLKSRLKCFNARIIDYRDIPHEAIVQRALNQRRPYRGQDRGYRDSLIWETILRYVITPEEKTLFIKIIPMIFVPPIIDCITTSWRMCLLDSLNFLRIALRYSIP